MFPASPARALSTAAESGTHVRRTAARALLLCSSRTEVSSMDLRGLTTLRQLPRQSYNADLDLPLDCSLDTFHPHYVPYDPFLLIRTALGQIAYMQGVAVLTTRTLYPSCSHSPTLPDFDRCNCARMHSPFQEPQAARSSPAYLLTHPCWRSCLSSSVPSRWMSQPEPLLAECERIQSGSPAALRI